MTNLPEKGQHFVYTLKDLMSKEELTDQQQWEKLKDADKSMHYNTDRTRTLSLSCIAWRVLIAITVTFTISLLIRQDCQIRELKHQTAESLAQMKEELNQIRKKSVYCAQRQRRSVSSENPGTSDNGENESEHVRREHHGIHNSSIALLSGDPAELEKHKNNTARNGKTFIHVARPDSLQDICAKLYRNSYGSGDYWCPPQGEARQLGVRDIFSFTATRTHNYEYFKEGTWMSTPKWLANYKTINHSQIKIRKTGMYIVFANVLFKREISNEIAQQLIVKRGDTEITIGQCSQTLSHNRSEGLSPCPSMVVTPLYKNDIVFLSIKQLVFFSVSRDSLQFGIIKLSHLD